MRSCVPESLRIPRHISDPFLGVWSCPFVCLDHLRIPRPILDLFLAVNVSVTLEITTIIVLQKRDVWEGNGP